MRDILKAQVEMAGPQYQAEAQYQPLYNALGAAQQAFQAQQSLNIAKQAYPQIAEMEADYNAANRQAELLQLQTALPEYQRAFNSLTPGYSEAVASTGQLAQSAMAQSLNRPQFSSFQNTVRDPYGRPVGGPQPQMAQMSYAQPQQQRPALQYQQSVAQPAQQGRQAQPAPNIQYDPGAGERLQQLSKDIQNNLPGAVAPPTNPGGAIDPTYSKPGKGQATRITNQPAIDARNAEIAKYGIASTSFKESEAKKQAGAGQYLGAFNPAAAFAPQQPTAPQTNQNQQGIAQTGIGQQVAQQAASANLLGAGEPPMSAAGGPAMPGISAGQMQGPALPPGFQDEINQGRRQGEQTTWQNAAQPAYQSTDPNGPAYFAPRGGQEQILAQQGAAIPAEQQAAYQQAFSQNQQQMQGQQGTAQQGGGKATPPPPQGGSYSDQMRGQLQGQMGMAPQTQEQVLARQGGAIPTGQQAAYQQAFSQNQQGQGQAMQGQPAKGGKGTPPPPQGPGGSFSGQMQQQMQAQQPYSSLQDTPAGGYVGAVRDFAPNQKIGQSANMLLNQSQRELAAGRSLTSEEQRMADQSARSAYAARGMALGNQAIGAEILNRADVSNQRYQQRLQNAASAAQVGLSQQELAQSAQAQRYQQAMGREELSANTQVNAFNQSLARNQAEQQVYNAGTQAQMLQSNLGNQAMSQLQASQAPMIQAFYKQPILQGQENQAQQMAMAMQQQAGPQYFNPESQTGMGSIYGAYNSQMNLAGAQAQANAAKSAGKSGMMGALGGAAIGAIGIAF